MNKTLKNLLVLIVAGGLMLAFSCKKTSAKKNSLQSGTGSFTIGGLTFTTIDTLGADVFNPGSDLTMWPTNTANAYDVLFIYYMPSASSGSTMFSDGSNGSSTVPFILGNFIISGDTVGVNSVAGSGSITKNSATSFSFSCTLAAQSNANDTFHVAGNGTY